MAERPESDVSQIEYRVETDPDGETGRLVREERVNILSDAPWAVQTDDMAEGVTEFKLRYLAGADWVDAWEAKPGRGLPRAVEVTVGLAGVGRAPAERVRIVVALPLAGAR